MYNAYLSMEGIEHSEVGFFQCMQEYGENTWPNNGDVTYVAGKVQCSVHTKEEDDGEVQFVIGMDSDEVNMWKGLEVILE